MTLEACFVDPRDIEKSIEVTSKGTLTMKLEITPHIGEETKINDHPKDIVERTTMHVPNSDKCNLQL